MTRKDTSLCGPVKPAATHLTGGASSSRPAGPFSDNEIPAQSGGGRSGDTRHIAEPSRHCGTDHDPAEECGDPRALSSSARCAGTTSAQSVEGHLLGSHGVESPDPQEIEDDGFITVYPKI